MNNQKRLIYADEAKAALTGWDTDPTDEEIEYVIDKIPTVDAVEVVHGRWIAERITNGTGVCPYFNGRVGDNRHNCVGAPFSCPCKQSSIWGKSTYHCSECGLEVGYSEKAKTNYCSSCGAKMDRKE